MNSKNNKGLAASTKRRYGLRKFSWGVASVLLGTTIYMWGGSKHRLCHD